MRKNPKVLRTLLNEITRSPDRSPLFWWMVEHHGEMARAAGGRPLRWSRLCERFIELGLTDARGLPASESTARATWRKARREVAAVEAREDPNLRPLPCGGAFPSRMSSDRRPDVVKVATPTTAMTVTSRPSWDLLPVSVEELPVVDPSGAPLEDGYVFYRNKPMLKRVAAQFLKGDRQAKELDRFK